MYKIWWNFVKYFVKYFSNKSLVTINFCQNKIVGEFSHFGHPTSCAVRSRGYVKWKLCPTTGWSALFHKKPTNSGAYLTLSILNLRIKHEPPLLPLRSSNDFRAFRGVLAVEVKWTEVVRCEKEGGAGEQFSTSETHVSLLITWTKFLFLAVPTV